MGSSPCRCEECLQGTDYQFFTKEARGVRASIRNSAWLWSQAQAVILEIRPKWTEKLCFGRIIGTDRQA